MYGLSTACARQRKQGSRYQIGGMKMTEVQKREPGRMTWKEMMQGFEKGGTSRMSGELQPKLETGAPGPVRANTASLDEPLDLLANSWGNLRGPAPPPDQLEAHDLNLSLQPSSPTKGMFDLNELPLEDATESVEDLQSVLVLKDDKSEPWSPKIATPAIGSIEQESTLPLVALTEGSKSKVQSGTSTWGHQQDVPS